MDNFFFAIKNPWRSGQSVKPPAIRRTCLDELDLWLKDDEVVVIYGPRRVGKSTLQSGSLVNLNELSSTLDAGHDTLARYLFYLEETFVMRRLLPFASNPRKELTKMPKVFFADCGLRNLVSAGFVDWEARADCGPLLLKKNKGTLCP